MPGELLLDTGAFVALLDRSEARHSDCVAVVSRWTGPLLTTEAVVTETIPMDCADGTLAALGEEAETDEVFTLDRKGFSTYRMRGRKTFRVVP